MAITVTAKNSLNAGPGVKLQFYSITLDSSYVGTAGEVADLSSEFPNEVFGAVVVGDPKGFEVKYHRATSGACSTGTLRVRTQAGGTTGVAHQMQHVATTTNLLSINFYLMAIGR